MIGDMDNASYLKGILFSSVGAIFFASMPIFAKYSYHNEASIFAVVLLRSAIGLVAFGLYLIWQSDLRKITFSMLHSSLGSGVAQVGATVGHLGSLAYLDVSLAVLIFFTHPILVALLEHRRGKVRFGTARSVYVALAFVGLALALSPSFKNIQLPGIFLGIVGSISAACVVFEVSKVARSVGVTKANFLMTGWALVITCFFAAGAMAMNLEVSTAFPSNSVGWSSLVCLGIAFSVSYVSFFKGASIIGNSIAASMVVFAPVVTIVAAVFLFDDSLDLVQWVGVGVVLFCLVALHAERLAVEQQR